ncbi:RagB/SusD family nutrient uptake outer membrane protein [Butyricimonas hominis]|uniref:RagB/SusD family nutrient uptake outer membrane protein n=1 Tax=Butyricimonas TaxID=574697 RepID=UPI00351461E6
MKKNIIYIWCVVVLLCGCGDFLEEQSQDLTYATNCVDLEELLVGGAYAAHTTNFKMLHVMDDDVNEFVYGTTQKGLTRGKLAGFYSWAKDPCIDEDGEYDDPVWSELYTYIGVTNAVLDKVDDFTDDLEEERNRVKGQAYFLRAYYYYYLVNLYAKPYSKITSESDLGVPLKTFAFIDDRYWGRASVAEVYDQIVNDLKTSIHCFSGMIPKSYYWAGEDAARVLLSRVYCYMGRWDSIPEVCNPLLKKYSLFDAVRNEGLIAAERSQYLISPSSPELIFTMGKSHRDGMFWEISSQPTSISTFQVSDELYALYNQDDCRKTLLFTYLRGGYYPKITKAGNNSTFLNEYISDIFTLRLSEVYLNLAEASAMTGDEAGARELLQELREKRIKSSSVGTVTESGENLIEKIRLERRLELPFEGHRWFDLRRYAVCPNYVMTKEIRHNHYTHTTGGLQMPGAYEGYYLLPPYPSNNWVLPIPGFEIEENEGRMENNERYESILY